ncbi:aspartate carbamoyltransferase [Candidatus Woesearchaeota archaeon]|nr:aspartate carbamoyltransferase [Candidatus Woesearchaeota archaeon]
MDIISIEDLSREFILKICKRASQIDEAEQRKERYNLRTKHPRKLATLFFEPSTRTQQSFKAAITELGGLHEGFSGTDTTSVSKKESIRDTIKMFEAFHFDAIVMRHKKDGSVQWAADVAKVPVINGGDGENEHPTQALLDLYTIYKQNKGSLDNVHIGLGGDLAHGRTVHSLSLALSKFKETTIYWSTEYELGMPEYLIKKLQSLGTKVIRKPSVAEVMKHVSVYYMTRPQLERMQGLLVDKIPALIEKYRIDMKKIEDLNGVILHPLPVNSELAEIEPDVFFSKKQGFYGQAENGVFVRKALLYTLLDETPHTSFDPHLSENLHTGNNRLQRNPGNHKTNMVVDTIDNGLVIDHLKKGKELFVADALQLVHKGYDRVLASISTKKTAFLKTNLPDISEREIRQVCLISPEPTISIIRDGKVIDKYVPLVCDNPNCITRDVFEDIPAKFYDDHGSICCRYCKHPYTIRSHKVSRDDQERYIKTLPEH